jgi:hypothetical protein
MVRRVFYFSIVDIGRTDNGGGLVCRNHCKRIAETRDVDLTICIASPLASRASVESFAASLGAKLHFVELKTDIPQPQRRWAFSFEGLAAVNRHINDDVLRQLRSQASHVVVVDYLFSALFAPGLYREARPVTVALNNEHRFFRETSLASGQKVDELAAKRLWLFEQQVYARSSAIVSLNPTDVRAVPWTSKAVIPPVFDPYEDQWTGGDGSIFFVGNSNHYPNRLAIDWLTGEFAERLGEMCPQTMIKIVGADAPLMARGSRLNVKHFGVSDFDTVRRLFTTSSLFIAPIANRFGSKMKLVDALSYGTPFVATEAALSGLPLMKVPEVDIADALGAARVVSDLLASQEKLQALSAYLSEYRDEMTAKQRVAWEHILR